MKAEILKIAGVKNEKEFYKKYPTEESFMAKHGKKLSKLVGGGDVPADALLQDFNIPGEAIATNDIDASVLANPIKDRIAKENPTISLNKQNDWNPLIKTGLNSIGSIIGSIESMNQEKKQLKELQKQGQVAGVVAQAAASRPERKQKKYVRPEDSLVSGANPYGVGTNYLQAENGAEIQNTYAPNVLYTDLGYEPLNDSNPKQFGAGGALTSALGGMTGALGGLGSMLGSKIAGGTGEVGPAGEIANTVGDLAGMIPGIGTVAGAAIKLGGGLIGGLIDAKGQKERKEAQDKLNNALTSAQVQGQISNFQNANSSFMEDGGWVSHDWQPQVIASFGEHKLKDLLKPDPMMDTLRAGGHLKEYTPPSARAMYTGRDLPYQMEDGGQMAMGGDLQVHRGYAEQISTNPYLPNGGETVMFRGPSHDDGGMPISYGENGVEVEGGEPAQVMGDGGQADNLVVFGNMHIPDYGANEIGDPKAKGMKFKRYIADLSKQEAKQNKISQKATDLINSSNTDDPFDLLAFNSGKAMSLGANMKLKDLANKKMNTAAVQNAILDTAEEHGLDSAKLAKQNIAAFGGKFTAMPIAKPGIKQPKTAKNTYNSEIDKSALLNKWAPNLGASGFIPGMDARIATPSNTMGVLAANANPQRSSFDLFRNLPVKESLPGPYQPSVTGTVTNTMGVLADSANAAPEPFDLYKGIRFPEKPAVSPYTPGFGYTTNTSRPNLKQSTTENTSVKDKDKTDWAPYVQTAASLASPFLRYRPSNELDPNQLTGEMLAMALNQEEPVQAQTYQPILAPNSPTYSLQDQLNEITAQSRDAMRLAQGDPSALAAINAQAYQAKSKVLGEQFRMNQQEKQRVAEQNRSVLNDAQLKNLAMYDQQYARQAEAKSKTKQQSIEIAKSISDKIAKNKLENKQLRVMENMYPAYSFTPEGTAYKNPFYQTGFNMAGLTSGKGGGLGDLETGKEFSYNKAGKIIGIHSTGKDEEKGKNGKIVKAFKNF